MPPAAGLPEQAAPVNGPTGRTPQTFRPPCCGCTLSDISPTVTNNSAMTLCVQGKFCPAARGERRRPLLPAPNLRCWAGSSGPRLLPSPSLSTCGPDPARHLAACVSTLLETRRPRGRAFVRLVARTRAHARTVCRRGEFSHEFCLLVVSIERRRILRIAVVRARYLYLSLDTLAQLDV